MSGVAETLQGAVDAANDAWPLAKAQAGHLAKNVDHVAERTEWEREMHALLDKAQAGKVEPEAFPIRTATAEELDWLIATAFKRPDSPGLEQVKDAISAGNKADHLTVPR